MRKVTVFAVAAGAGVLLTGCVNDVMHDRHYIPAPTDNVPVIENTQPMMQQPIEMKPVQPSAYKPMTDVQSSGGVDSAASGKKVSGGSVYVVKRGDYPGLIARKHKVRLRDLMKANNLTEASAKKLRVGQKLVIPGKSAAVNNVAPRKKDAKVDNAPAPALQGGKYTVKRGDSPERIARRYKIKVSDLMKANNLDEAAARRLQIGQKLIIPGKGDVVENIQNADVANSGNNNAADVQKNDAADTVVSDAATTSTDTVTDLEESVVVEVPKDMTLAEAAAHFKVSEDAVRRLNKGLDVSNMTKGTLICIPPAAK